jgi:monovalent cation/proton antiporter MnhG/PhaG subunit
VSGQTVVEAVLLVVAVGAELICCLGLLVMDDVFARLHYQSGVGTIGPAAIALAVVVEGSLSSTGVKAVLIVAVIWITGPVLTHAIGAVARERRDAARKAGR